MIGSGEEPSSCWRREGLPHSRSAIMTGKVLAGQVTCNGPPPPAMECLHIKEPALVSKGGTVSQVGHFVHTPENETSASLTTINGGQGQSEQFLNRISGGSSAVKNYCLSLQGSRRLVNWLELPCFIGSIDMKIFVSSSQSHYPSPAFSTASDPHHIFGS